jgi:3'(2'), 5'-bisphosphate nucleotidase
MKKYINPKYDQVIETVIESGKIALKYFKPNQETAYEIKSDESPVTKADLEVNQYLTESLKKFYPSIKTISEEGDVAENLAAILSDKTFIIDPIDGTDSFIKGSKEFTINVALKLNSDLVMGIIYLPVDDVLYYADSWFGCYKIINATGASEVIKITQKNNCAEDKITIITTRREDEFEQIKKLLSGVKQEINFINIASSLKFCFLCDGNADAYYRAARIKIWDVAAGFALVKACGFEITNHHNDDLLKIIFDKFFLENSAKNQFRIEPFIIRKS